MKKPFQLADYDSWPWLLKVSIFVIAFIIIKVIIAAVKYWMR